MSRTPDLSVVVISYNTRRELPRTLLSLSSGYQRGIAREDYEVIVVDNGSADPPSPADFEGLDVNVSVLRYPEPTQSPVGALNLGIERARAPLIGAMIDGARMVSPGFLDACRRASHVDPMPVITFLSFHIGPAIQWSSMREGYDQDWEDRLLRAIGWPENGYRLFDIAPYPENVQQGWFAALGESNALFMHRPLWDELGGFDPAFDSPGGGAANPDMLTRALNHGGTRQIVVLGEATFHQFHGGTVTNSGKQFLTTMKEVAREMARIRGHWPRTPDPERIYFGPVSKEATRTYYRLVANGGAEAASSGGFSTKLKPYRYAMDPAAYRTPVAAADYVGETLNGLKEIILGGGAAPSECPAGPEDGGGPGALGDAGGDGQGEDAFARLRRSVERRSPRLRRSSRGQAPGFAVSDRAQIEHLEWCVNALLDDGVPGDFFLHGPGSSEVGLLIQAILVARAAAEGRALRIAEACPDPAAHAAQIGGVFGEFGLDAANLRLHPAACSGRDRDRGPLAMLRLADRPDGPALQALRDRYDDLSEGGFVIVTRYGAHSGGADVDSFRADRGLTDGLDMIDCAGAFWRKPAKEGS